MRGRLSKGRTLAPHIWQVYGQLLSQEQTLHEQKKALHTICKWGHNDTLRPNPQISAKERPQAVSATIWEDLWTLCVVLSVDATVSILCLSEQNQCVQIAWSCLSQDLVTCADCKSDTVNFMGN